MKRLLIVGRARSCTGFGRVLRTIADGLASSFTVHVLALDVYVMENVSGWQLHANESDLDPNAERKLPQVVAAVCPDVVLLFNDYWLIAAQATAVRRQRDAFIVAYIPIDTRIVNPQSIAALASVDQLVLYCDWAEAELLRCATSLNIENHPAFRRRAIIPHPTRSDLFYPLCRDRALSRNKARKELGWNGLQRDSFVVLNANKNARRKRLDLTLTAFARFAKDKPRNVLLYLHTGLREIGVDLRRHIAAYGLADRVMFTETKDNHPDVDEHRLNLLYNACDVGVNTSIGEGWGLVSFEHASTGAAQVVPRHSACAELWEGAAELVEPEFTVRYGISLEGSEVSPERVAGSFGRLYADPRHLERLGNAALRNALRPEFRPASIAEQWRSVLTQAVSSGVS